MDQPQSCIQCFIAHWTLRSAWQASDCNRCWCQASYHLLDTDTRQQCLTLERKPWYHCGANAEMVVVTMFRSVVFHLLHMCHVLIRVKITFWHESVCLFESSLYIHCSLSRWVSIIYWKSQMSCLKMFSCILQVFVWNVWCCTISKNYYARGIPLFIAVGVIPSLCVYLSCWVATYVYSWINIYRGWTNNGNN